ncbi:MAG: helix-turn-helix domain-containing protein [Planctomycetaceae bacterium]|nr:helix-turn-helix domain-containing protein [Planctomycetaceae bacterium]
MSKSPLPCDNSSIPSTSSKDDPTAGQHFTRRRMIAGSQLSTSEKLLLHTLLTYLQGNEWCYPSVERLARDCSLSDDRIKQLLRKLKISGVVITKRRRNETALRRIDWSRLSQDVQLTALPESPNCQQAQLQMHSGLHDGGATRCRSERGADNTQKEPKKEPKKEPTQSAKRASKRAAVDELEIQQVMNSWNEVANACGLSVIRKLTAQQQRALRARLSEPDWCAHWRTALDKLSKSTFLKGGGARGWKANFDWLVKPDSVNSLIEGKYDDGERSSNNKKRTGSAHEYDPAATTGPITV